MDSIRNQNQKDSVVEYEKRWAMRINLAKEVSKTKPVKKKKERCKRKNQSRMSLANSKHFPSQKINRLSEFQILTVRLFQFRVQRRPKKKKWQFTLQPWEQNGNVV